MKERTTSVRTSMLGIANKAKSDKRYRFRNLYRELNEELLLDSWRLLRKDAALGVNRVKKWLKAGVLDTNGQVLRPESGTPQGGIISPVLANVYLHYALDLWFEKAFRRSCKGAAFLHRYADDFVCGFGRAEEAERFYNGLEERLRKFGLELAQDKTRVMPFSRYRQGETSFEFLGFEFRWAVNRKVHAWLKRRTARKKLRNSLERVTQWCRQNRHRRLREQVQLLNAKLRGYKNYYRVSGNSASLDEFFYHVRRIHQRWLNQRSQRHSYTWAAYNELMCLLGLEQPRIVPVAKQSL